MEWVSSFVRLNSSSSELSLTRFTFRVAFVVLGSCLLLHMAVKRLHVPAYATLFTLLPGFHHPCFWLVLHCSTLSMLSFQLDSLLCMLAISLSWFFVASAALQTSTQRSSVSFDYCNSFLLPLLSLMPHTSRSRIKSSFDVWNLHVSTNDLKTVTYSSTDSWSPRERLLNLYLS